MNNTPEMQKRLKRIVITKGASCLSTGAHYMNYYQCSSCNLALICSQKDPHTLYEAACALMAPEDLMEMLL